MCFLFLFAPCPRSSVICVVLIWIRILLNRRWKWSMKLPSRKRMRAVRHSVRFKCHWIRPATRAPDKKLIWHRWYCKMSDSANTIWVRIILVHHIHVTTFYTHAWRQNACKIHTSNGVRLINNDKWGYDEMPSNWIGVFFMRFSPASVRRAFGCIHFHSASMWTGLLDAVAKGLLNDEFISSARVLLVNITNGAVITSVWWSKNVGDLGIPNRIEDDGMVNGMAPSADYPWYEDERTSPAPRSPKFIASPENMSFLGWWTYPYYSCKLQAWLLSYSIAVTSFVKHG